MNPAIMHDSFADELPYGPMLPGHPDVVLLHEPPRSTKTLQRFALGALWQITPRNIDVMPEEAIVRLADDIRSLPFLLPEGAVFDVRMDMRPGHAIPAWEQKRLGLNGPVQWQRAHIAQGMPHATGSGRSRLYDYAVTLGIRVPFDPSLSYTRADWLLLCQYWRARAIAAHLEHKFQTTYAQALAEFVTLASAMDARLRLLGFAPRRLDGPGVVTALGRALDPLAGAAPLYDPGQHLRFQPAMAVPTLSAHGCKVGTDREGRVFSLRKSIGDTYPGMLCAPRTPGGTAHGFDLWTMAHDWPVSLVVQCWIVNQHELRTHLSRKQSFAKWNEKGTGGNTRGEVEIQESNLRTLVQRMSTGAERTFKTGVHLIIWGPQSSFRPLDNVITQAGVGLGIEWIPEGNTYFIQTLPLARNPEWPHERWMQRMKDIPATHIADFLPLWGSFRGTRTTPTVPYLNRRGEDVLYDPFDGFKSPHVTFVGSSRSGKSLGFNHLLHHTLPLGATALGLDMFGSYEALCHIYHGTHVRIDLDRPFCFGPFEGPLDVAHRTKLLAQLAEMASWGDEQHALKPQALVILAQLLRRWARTREAAAPQTMSAFMRTVEEHPVPGSEALCQELALLLSPYYGDGEYAGFVDGPNELQLTEGLCVFDISELDNAPWLQAVLVMILFDRFERFIRDPGLRSVPKFILADEVSFLLRSPRASRFLRKLAVALARFYCSFVVLSQQFTDFKTDIGRAIINNTGTFFYFSLNTDEVMDIKDTFQLESHYVSLISSLRRYEDCSEALLHIPQGESGIVRVIPDSEFLTRIGQDQIHRVAREQQEADQRKDQHAPVA